MIHNMGSTKANVKKYRIVLMNAVKQFIQKPTIIVRINNTLKSLIREFFIVALHFF